MPTTKTETTPPHAGKSLVAKLSEITGKLAHIEKKGFNKAQNYRFARESDVAAEASRLFAEYNVFLTQSVVRHFMKPLYETQRGGTMYLSTVFMVFQFLDGDSDERSEHLTFVGYGADTGDKGIYKAMTGAEKYFLMKTFLISTGDDPEADESVDRATAAAGAARGGRRVTKSDQPGVQRGGKSTSATEAQINEIAKIVRDREIDPAGVLVPLIVDVTGKPEPEEGAKLREWLGTFTAKELAGVVARLNTDAEPEVITDEGWSNKEAVEELGMGEDYGALDDEQEGFGIV